VLKSSDELPLDADIQAQAEHPWVSRGGVKLSGALERYPIDIDDKVCLDVGASTGGFTEVLLSCGASREETDIRSLAGQRLEVRPTVVVIDVSFISLKHVLPVALELAATPTHLLALIKPQFEAQRRAIRKGIVRDESVHRAVCDDIAAFAASLGCREISVFPSSIAGGDGNREFFLGARRG
jgi:23S rRNA (cytidine1920-2'-O)/16S rRNA (cytidine1409-2'-O)-methyltransferase